MRRPRPEEKPLLPRTMQPEERRKAAARIARELARRREVLLAILYGGFTRRRLFRDIDVAVYTAGRIGYDDEPYYTYTLSLELTRLLKVSVDVKLLDYAPPGFRVTVLVEGHTLLEKKPGLRWSLLLRALDEAERLQQRRHLARP